ncbi:hypothetical protein P153DRAFT_380939 [Dothidotthia symphoricarpi CBS 119687]|uniref:Uncharacterized protein n=1 Tax=Dothidotthia symphoricarpi CBS 119687 TaxID=1392245 RepID=A0A6A6ASD9_9PLEO|nr:uncharacterized protein P153DRAFT_380939 [Dothidotthia symphoricarpi CBS 119687]KAF2133757.1 hypothetical protein P153DRAFT_380939 [Dothidotthia symphoricarpi CBS 119687]
MYHHTTIETMNNQSTPNRLTEQNLQLHTTHFQNKARTYSIGTDQTWEPYHQLDDDDFEGSEDGDLDTRRHNIELRRAASLEALKIYGGCFASGFLAMQESWRPTPTASQRQLYYLDVETLELRELASEMSSIETGSIETGSTRSGSSIGRPRPDSVTLSPIGAQEGKSERKWSWKSLGKKRRNKSNKSPM